MLMFTRGESGNSSCLRITARGLQCATRDASGKWCSPPPTLTRASRVKHATGGRNTGRYDRAANIKGERLSSAAAQVSAQHCMLATIVAVTCFCSRLPSTPVKSID